MLVTYAVRRFIYTRASGAPGNGNYEWRGWRDGNGVSAIWVEWASGAGNGSGARIGTGDFTGVGECWSGHGAGFARYQSGRGIAGRDTEDGEKSAGAADGHE